MKKLLLSIIALALSGSALLAQSLVGTWQGTLKVPQAPNGELRTVFKISTTDADNLKAVLYSIDQPGQGIPATTVTAQGSTVKIAITGIGGNFEGKLSADGNTIAGTWTQGPAPLALTLTRATNQTAWTIPEPPPPAKPMPADADPGFEVATIKPSKPDAQGKGFTLSPGAREIITRNTTVSDLITFAYQIHTRQITGGPAWFDTDHYDVTGKPDVDGMPNTKQYRAMLQKLLADRFKLSIHHDKKELTVYTLAVGKTGSKLTKAVGNPSGLPGLFFRGLGRLAVTNATMQDFVELMQGSVMDRPVVDQTGLTGRWDFQLNWTPDDTQFGGRGGQTPPQADTAEVPPDLFTAIQQQLGLKMESAKAPVDVLVIDKVEKPSEN
jgi:uncharacterized protein (TIGR03435 family)